MERHEQRADADRVAIGERTGAVTRSPPRNVPFLLPKSSSIAPSAVTTSRAWRRETVEASSLTSTSGSRPTTCSPVDSGNRRVAPLEPARRLRPTRARAGRRAVDRLAAERIAESVRGADEHRRAGAIAERFANLGHQVRKIGFGHERVGPEPLLQHGLRQHLRTIHRRARSSSNAFGDSESRGRARVSCRVSRSSVNGPKRISRRQLGENLRRSWESPETRAIGGRYLTPRNAWFS